jgi:hypothetical protein
MAGRAVNVFSASGAVRILSAAIAFRIIAVYGAT